MSAATTSPRTASPPESEYFHPEVEPRLRFSPHPMIVQIEEASVAWAERWVRPCLTAAAWERHLDMRIGLWWPLCTPHGDAERVLLMDNWWHLVTCIDDAVADDPHWSSPAGGLSTTAAALRRLLDAEEPEADFPLGRAIVDIWTRLVTHTSADLRRRLLHGIDVGLAGFAQEMPYRYSGVAPDLTTYLTARSRSFANPLLFTALEYSLAVDLTALFTAKPDLFDEVHRHAAASLTFGNDMFSIRQEVARGDMWNAVSCLRAHEGLSVQQAVDRCCELTAHHRRALFDARDRVLATAHGRRHDVRLYLDEIEHMLAGSEEMHYLSPRYQGRGYHWDGTRSGWVDLASPTTVYRDRPRHATPG